MYEDKRSKEVAEKIARESLLKEAERRLLEQQDQSRNALGMAPAADLLGNRKRNTSPEMQELDRQVSMIESEMQVRISSTLPVHEPRTTGRMCVRYLFFITNSACMRVCSVCMHMHILLCA